MGVHLVHINSDDYASKEVTKPLYIPRDSDVLELELLNLERMQSSEGVVRLIAVVPSNNLYRTTKVTEEGSPASL
jgi:hypothetical protein